MITLMTPENQWKVETLVHDLGIDETKQFAGWKKILEQFAAPDDTSHELFFVEEENVALATMSMYWWSQIPAWTQAFVIARTRTQTFNLRKNRLAELLEFCLERAEDEQVFTYYSFVKARTYGVWLRKWSEHVPAFRRYEATVDEYIPANQSSRYSMFWNLADGRTHPEDFVIRRSTLRPEYRT